MSWRRSLFFNRKRSKGQALVEMAVITPILAIVILGMTELGTTLAAHITVINASREGARIAARGNIYADADIIQVVEEHSGTIDLTSRGSIVITQVTSTAGGFTSHETRSLLGSSSSKFTETQLATMYDTASAADPSYLKTDKFVMIEVFYRHNTITSFLADHVDLYSYTLMPVSAPS
jgi:Flp pilus assembly protein TadG